MIYGIAYDDGEQEDLFVEELLRHIDEDQPLDAARVEHLHRNVKPDGDQKWQGLKKTRLLNKMN